MNVLLVQRLPISTPKKQSHPRYGFSDKETRPGYGLPYYIANATDVQGLLMAHFLDKR